MPGDCPIAISLMGCQVLNYGKGISLAVVSDKCTDVGYLSGCGQDPRLILWYFDI